MDANQGYQQINFVLLVHGYLKESQKLSGINLPNGIISLIEQFYPLSSQIKYYINYNDINFIVQRSQVYWDQNTEHVFKSLTISNFASMGINASGSLIITVFKNFVLGKFALLQVGGKGFKGGGYGEQGCAAYIGSGGHGAVEMCGCGAGGGYDTKGGDADDMGGIIANGGNVIIDKKHLFCGSGGGASKLSRTMSIGGNGGGIIILRVYGSIIFHEYTSIQANGSVGYSSRDGCGSGGTILISFRHLIIINKKKKLKLIEANGGRNLRGNSGYYGGDGGNGRIIIDCRDHTHHNEMINLCSPQPCFM